MVLYDAEVIINHALFFHTVILRRTLSYYFMNKCVRHCHPIETDKNIIEKSGSWKTLGLSMSWKNIGKYKHSCAHFDVITSLASVCWWKIRVRYCTAIRESVTVRSGALAYGEWVTFAEWLAEQFGLIHHPSALPTTLGGTCIDHIFIRNMNTECMPFISYFSYHKPLLYRLALKK
jgi:hypothetical protein